MKNLIEKWRQMAEGMPEPVARTLRSCADELEKVWHDEHHGDIFRQGCPHCEREWIDYGDGDDRQGEEPPQASYCALLRSDDETAA